MVPWSLQVAFSESSFFLSIPYTLKFKGGECSCRVGVTEIDWSSVNPVIGIHEPCVSRNAPGTLWDSDPQAVRNLAGEMKIHRRANTRNPGITACWQIHRKSCWATERSARAGRIREWAGSLDLKDILGTEDQHNWQWRFRPLQGLFLVSWSVKRSVWWEVRCLVRKCGDKGLMALMANTVGTRHK